MNASLSLALLDTSMNISSTGVSETNMADQNLTCTDCGKQFTFTESEQEFYQSKGFSTPVAALIAAPPARLRVTAAALRQWQQLRRRQQPMAAAAATAANARCTRWFAPSAARTPKCLSRPAAMPVYCSDCFRSQPGNSSGGRSGGGSNYGGGSRSGGSRY